MENNIVYFETIVECTNFVKYLHNRNIDIISFCSHGLGCNMSHIHEKNIEILKQDFFDFQNNVPYQKVCDICFEYVDYLCTRCSEVTHLCCLNCWNRLQIQCCPFCRKDLS